MEKRVKDIDALIRNGENSLVEFKHEQFHADSLAKVIVAFANTHGGDILIGVEDDGQVSGVNDKSVEEKIVQICRNNVSPPLLPLITSATITGKKLYRVTIEKGAYKPYKVKTTNKFYIRAGSVSVEPTNEELMRLFQNGEQLYFEIHPIPGTSLADADLVKFRDYCEHVRNISLEEYDLPQFLKNLQIITTDEQITLAGMLFFGRTIEYFLPQAGIELACFRGTDVDSEIIDAKDVVQDVPRMIAAAEDFVRYHSRKQAYFNQEQTRRIDRYDYEPFAIRELLANAFAHRDWSIFGQKIRLRMFEDRLEIFSPGKLPNTLNLESALSGISYYRNPIIAQWLRDYQVAEKVGRGLFKIMKFYRQHHYPLPEFKDDPAYFQATLPNVNR